MASLTSPMQPVAPPSKKMKAGSGIESVDAVKKRRDELNRLRQKQQMRTTEKTTPGGSKVKMTSSQDLLAQARSQLDASQGPPRNSSGPPPPPGAVPLDRVRHSDIFPTVGKVDTSGRAPPPPRTRPMQQGPPSGGRPVEPVVRRLDQSFGQGKSPSAPPPNNNRAKSAPHARPPPPPPGQPPSAAKEAPATTTPSRSFAARPPPMTPGASKAPPAPPTSTNKEAMPPVTTPLGPPGGARSMTPPPMNPVPTQIEPSPVPQSPKVAAVESTKSTDETAAQANAPIPDSSTEPETEKPTTPFLAAAPVPFPATPFVAAAPVPAPAPAPIPLSGAGAPPQSNKPRQELIRNLHQFADTPAKQQESTDTTEPAAKHESSLLRLEKEVREHEKAKTDALRKVAILEDQLLKLKEKGDPEEELGHLVQMADNEGENAALQWARQRISGATPKASTPQVGFFSPLSPGLATPRAKSRKRVATPHPKRNAKEEGSGLPEGASNDVAFLAEAVKFTPFEYATDLATFTIRRPYGVETERDLWFNAGHSRTNQYERTADVTKPPTLEVVAHIAADKSALALHGDAVVRHRADEDGDWNEFGSVDDLNKPLGSITYIDGDAIEKDYSLDDLFEGAVAARENYCASVVSMAVGLQKKGTIGEMNSAPPIAFPGAAPPMPKPPTAEIGVGTEDLPFPPPAEGQGSGGEVNPEKMSPPPMDVDDAPDSLSFLFGTFISFLIWILKTLLITFPVKVVSFTFFSLIAFILLAIITLQIADDPGAAGFDTMFNEPGLV